MILNRGEIMPRPIFSNKNKENLDVTIKPTIKVNEKMDILQLEKRLRVKRSSEYMEAIKNLDIGGCEDCKKQFDDCVEVIKNEFKDIPNLHQLIGILAKCALGQPYDVHTVDITGNIVTHYKKYDVIPSLIETARGLALHGGYAYVEVYTDLLCAVKEDGTVNIIK